MGNIFKKNPLGKWVVVYSLIILFGTFLFPATWGGVNGLLVVSRIATDPSFYSEVTKSIGEPLPEKDSDYLKRLPPEKRDKIFTLFRKRFKDVNWLPIHLIVNFITFAILGFLAGIVLKDFLLSGIIPLVLLFETLWVLKVKDFIIFNKYLTISIGIATQFITVYLFSYLGYRVKEKMDRKKMLKQS